MKKSTSSAPRSPASGGDLYSPPFHAGSDRIEQLSAAKELAGGGRCQELRAAAGGTGQHQDGRRARSPQRPVVQPQLRQGLSGSKAEIAQDEVALAHRERRQQESNHQCCAEAAPSALRRIPSNAGMTVTGCSRSAPSRPFRLVGSDTTPSCRSTVVRS